MFKVNRAAHFHAWFVVAVLFMAPLAPASYLVKTWSATVVSDPDPAVGCLGTQFKFWLANEIFEIDGIPDDEWSDEIIYYGYRWRIDPEGTPSGQYLCYPDPPLITPTPHFTSGNKVIPTDFGIIAAGTHTIKFEGQCTYFITKNGVRIPTAPISTAWLPLGEKEFNVVKVVIGMDGNRDGSIDFDDPDDENYLFWVNNDHDERHYLQTELAWVEDDLGGDPDCDNNYIGFKSGLGSSCKRDLEDFTRLHIRVDDTTANLSGITYRMKIENGTDNPAVNIFEAVGESSAYLSQVSVADNQIQKTRLLTVDATEQTLPSQYIKKGNQRSCFILEGKHRGTGELTFIVKKDGNEICRKAVSLELHDMPWFYSVYSVGVTSGDRWEVQVPTTAIPPSQTASYPPATDEKFLLVHGWNMTDPEKIQWAETTFKRLWWQGYQGSVALFSWPTLQDFNFWDFLSGARHFDNSEFRSWLSADALVSVFNTLNAGGKLRIMAHSMGNVVTGEAIHRYTGGSLHTYLACQASLSGHYYDNALTPVFTSPDTPNIIGHFPDGVDDSSYLAANCSKVTKRVNYFNEDDWALDKWESNNGLKPDDFTPYFFWYDGRTDQYEEGVDHFVRGIVGDIWNVYSVNTPHDLWIILSYIAESRSKALGQTSVATSQFGAWDLKTEMLYDDEHYSHSKQFRSTVSEQWEFWKKVRQDCNFVPSY